MWKQEIQIKFRQADPAGIMFFGRIFELAHDSFENFIQDCGFDWQEWFRAEKYIVPIRHAEADFKSPFVPGAKYEVRAGIEKFGESSFVMKYEFWSQKGQHATVKMVHAILDRKTKQKTALPADFKEKFKAHIWAH